MPRIGRRRTASCPRFDSGVGHPELPFRIRHSYSSDNSGPSPAAQAAFEEVMNAETQASRRRQLEQALLSYCALDTLAMVELVRTLSRNAPTTVGGDRQGDTPVDIIDHPE